MAPTMHTLDFNDVPIFEMSKFFVRLDREVSEAIAGFPQTAERALCATHFCWRISFRDDRASDTAVALRQGYMRASLAEFVGMEEALARDLHRLAIPAKPIKANSGRRPLLHIIRELRNFEIHLHSSPLTEQRQQAIWPAPRKGEEINYVDHHSWIIDDLTENEFSKLKNAKYYRIDDIRRLVAWFKSAQRKWGVHDLILRAIETFCNDIISRYSVYLPKESEDA